MVVVGDMYCTTTVSYIYMYDMYFIQFGYVILIFIIYKIIIIIIEFGHIQHIYVFRAVYIIS